MKKRLKKRAGLIFLCLMTLTLDFTIVGCETPIEKVTPDNTTGKAATAVRPPRAPQRRVIPKPKSISAVAPRFLGMRKFPYPYKCMLSITSDADHETLRKFNEVHRFINTNEMTDMGQGLGLDVSDSFFMYNGSDISSYVDINFTPQNGEWTYFKGISNVRSGGDVMDAYIKAGWIDSIHTYGDFSMNNPMQTNFSRSLAVNAVNALKQNNDFLTVWIDHGNKANVDNFGSFGLRGFFNYQHGSNPASPYYHTDLLIPYGIKFVWADRDGSVFGHDSMISPFTLRDGRKVWAFPRFTSTGYTKSGATIWAWSAGDLDDELTAQNLSSIERDHQYAIVAQHLCSDNSQIPLPYSAISALKRLQTEYQNKNILVARTSRLLQYNVTQKYLRYYTTMEDSRLVIHVTTVDDPVFGSRPATLADVRGVTFYTTNPALTDIALLSGKINASLRQENKTDGVAESIMIKWYPTNLKDYSTGIGAVTPT